MILKATAFTEDSAGYGRLLELLGTATDCLVSMEATGHYWRNLYAALVTAGFAVALNQSIAHEPLCRRGVAAHQNGRH